MPLVEGMDRLPDMFAERHHRDVADVLRIGAGQTSAAYLLPKYVERFRKKRGPEVGIEIRTGTGKQRLGWLRGYELDLVVGSVDVAPTDVDFRPVFASELVLITAADHALAGRESVGMEEAAAYVGHRATRYVSQVAEIMLQLRGVAPDVVVEVDGWSVITNYVAAGVGISLVPDLSLTEHERLFDGLPQRFEGGRDHSLFTDRGTFPDALAITTESDEGIVMAVGHPDLPVAAVQFHPESILTLDEDAGMAVVMNVMRGLGR